MTCEALLTVRTRVSSGAGLKSASPAWFAVIVADPALTICIMVPETVATSGLSEVYVTGRPELAVAPGLKSGSPNVFAGIAVNVMV